MYICIYMYMYALINIIVRHIHNIFIYLYIQGYSSKYLLNFEINVGVFGVENVSFWNNDTLWFPLLQLLLLLVPLPAVYLGYMKGKDDSEDVMFILALLSVLSVVGSGVYMSVYVYVYI
jgi:hypothetical protein